MSDNDEGNRIEEARKLFKESREKIESIEKEALRILAVRRLSKDASEEEISAKIVEISKEQERYYMDHQEEIQKAYDAIVSSGIDND